MTRDVSANNASRAVFALFFLSGATGLVYQVVWSRLLNDVFGITAWAVTAVLATYLGGLALGSWLLGRVADRQPNALRAYAWLELGVGATALAGTWIVRYFEPVHAWAATRFEPDSLALLALRLALASIVILPPTFLMGGTLPAMTRAVVERMQRLGGTLSVLYALNTAGAVAGSLLAGFVLIRAIGVHGTLWLAVAGNAAIGLVALWLARGQAAALPEEPSGAAVPRVSRAGLGLLVAFGLSGVASIALEVIWTRELVLLVGTSTYAFVTMLSTFLVGIALGSALARTFVDRLTDARRAFGWLEAAIAVSTLATVPLLAWVAGSAQPWFEDQQRNWFALTAGRFGISFLVMIVPTTLIGMTFPVAARLWARNMGSLGGRLGQVYGANALGNIAGAIVGGFLLIPRLGLQRGVVVLTLFNLAAAAWGLFPRDAWRVRRVAALRSAPLALGLAAAMALVVLWHPRPFACDEEGPFDRLMFYDEGVVSTVKVIARADDARQRLMFVDGARIGQSSAGVDRKQQVLAHFPFLLMPGRPPQRVLTIGLGTGIMTGEVARHPSAREVEVVELSDSVIAGARQFDAFNDRVLDNRAVRVINDDGINYLRRSPETYDAIVSDGKSRLGHAGNGSFYAAEYLASARDHLAPDGVMIQWVPLDVPAEDLQLIVRTFRSVFRFVYAWLDKDSCFLVGRAQPLVLDLGHIQRELDAPACADLRRHGWQRATDVLGLLVADSASLAPWLGTDDRVNSREHPLIEFYSLRELAAPTGARVAKNLASLVGNHNGSLAAVRLEGFDPAVAARADDAVRHLVEGFDALAASNPVSETAGFRLVGQALAEAPDNGVLRQWAASAMFGIAFELDLRGARDEAVAMYGRALDTWPGFTEARVNLARLLASRQRAEAVAHLQRALADNPESGAAHRLLGDLLQAAGDQEGAIEHLRAAARIAPDLAEVHDDLGFSLSLEGRFDDALLQFRDAMRLHPDWALAMSRAALVLATNPDPQYRDPVEAERLASRAVQLTRHQDPTALEVLAATYAAEGRWSDAVSTEQQVVDMARRSGNEALSSGAEHELEAYRSGRTLTTIAP